MSRVKTSQQFSVYFFVNIKKIVINIKNSNLVFVCVCVCYTLRVIGKHGDDENNEEG